MVYDTADMALERCEGKVGDAGGGGDATAAMSDFPGVISVINSVDGRVDSQRELDAWSRQRLDDAESG